MTGQVAFEYDPVRNIVFTFDKWNIETRQDVDEFFSHYYRFFERLGRKTYMVSHIDGLLVQGPIAEYYAEIAHGFTSKHLIGFTRWGTNNWARMSVRTTALKAGMAPCIYSTREEAINAVGQDQHSIKAGEFYMKLIAERNSRPGLAH